jgi:hypothetical protein
MKPCKKERYGAGYGDLNYVEKTSARHIGNMQLN